MLINPTTVLITVIYIGSSSTEAPGSFARQLIEINFWFGAGTEGGASGVNQQLARGGSLVLRPAQSPAFLPG